MKALSIVGQGGNSIYLLPEIKAIIQSGKYNRFCGTSAGAPLAAMIACGYSYEKIVEGFIKLEGDRYMRYVESIANREGNIFTLAYKALASVFAFRGWVSDHFRSYFNSNFSWDLIPDGVELFIPTTPFTIFWEKGIFTTLVGKFFKGNLPKDRDFRLIDREGNTHLTNFYFAKDGTYIFDITAKKFLKFTDEKISLGDALYAAVTYPGIMPTVKFTPTVKLNYTEAYKNTDLAEYMGSKISVTDGGFYNVESTVPMIDYRDNLHVLATTKEPPADEASLSAYVYSLTSPKGGRYFQIETDKRIRPFSFQDEFIREIAKRDSTIVW